MAETEQYRKSLSPADRFAIRRASIERTEEILKYACNRNPNTYVDLKIANNGIPMQGTHGHRDWSGETTVTGRDFKVRMILEAVCYQCCP